MRRRVMPVLILALLAVVLMGGAAYGAVVPEPPYETSAECLECHGVALGGAALSKVEFADTVDYSACVKCHWVNPRAPYVFNHEKVTYFTSCSDCHSRMKTARLWGGQVTTVYGYFASTTSLSSSPAAIHAAHVSGSWPQGGSAVDCDEYCKSCHGATGCSMCHTASLAEGSHGRHVAAAEPLLREYAPTVYATAAGSPIAPTVVSTVNYASTSVSCAASGCHPRATLTTAPVPTCGSCHPLNTTEHGYTVVDHVAADSTLDGTACSACHTLDLATAHGDSGAAGASCATCHPSPRDTLGAWDQSCTTGGCHTATSTAPMHANIATSHTVASANTLCLDCHQGTDLGSIHSAATDPDTGKTSCFVCHTGVAGEPATNDCTVCHFTFDTHYDATAHTSMTVGCSGEGCHSVTSGLMAVHEERDATFGCFGCHNSIRAAVQDAIAAGDTSCGACHGAISGLGGHRDAHAAVPPLANADGTPNYSYYTGAAGTAPTRDCVGCHTSNLTDEHLGLYLGGWVIFPRHDASGAPLTCGTCHDQPVGSAVQNAITGGLSACESCHSIHAPMQAVHASAFVDSPDVPCVDCHSSNLADEHNGGYTSTAGLSGCDVCHELYAGAASGSVTGAATQAAISTGNDTRCSACHAAYHTNSTAHQASGTASLVCGTCHAVGATAIDVTSLHPTCATCHSSVRIGEIPGHTAECTSCHAAEGADYHSTMAAGHTFTGMASGCTSCHPATLPEAHESYLSRYPEYADTCALCHKNADPARIDWTTASADCSSCHTVHGDLATLHTATASDACVRCHDSADLRVLHGATMDASCAACHNATFDLTGKTAECTTCHYTGGVEYHLGANLVHTGLGSTGTCEGAGCHPSRDVTVIHDRFIGPGTQYPQYEDTCALCHINDDPSRIDWSVTTDGACANCHGVPHDRMNHTSSSTMSQDCVGCHSLWVPDTHGANPPDNGTFANCDICHNNPLAGNLTWDKTYSDCEGCHAKYPAATNHYPAEKHLTSHEYVCVDCHYQDLKTEHAKASIDVTCVECHTDASDAAVIAAGWNRTCDQCHMDMHNDKTTRHASTRTDCSTSGCHESDVSAIHSALPGMGCSSCHMGAAQLDTDLTKDCTTSGCHDIYHEGVAVAHTASASTACTRCHDAALPDGSQLEPLHGSACAKCHNTTIDASTKTAECTSCHNSTVSPFHLEMTTVHTYGAMGAACQQVGCHLKTLPEEHAKYLDRYTGYADSCALCHENTDAGRIDWSTASASCGSCHTIHGDITEIHTAATSAACIDCHETGDAMLIHVTDTGDTDCGLCHAAPEGRIDWTTATIECASCHGALSPVDPSHYPSAAHDATAESGCGQCHYMDMKTEHLKDTVAVSCVTCHEVKVDTFTAAWDKTCAACHPTKHGAKNAKHTSTTATCGGTGCHAIGDVASIHQALGGSGCYVCHKDAGTPATTTDCTTSGCHAGVGTDHKGLHDAVSVNPAGCSGCHFTNLVDEHEKLGFTCATCHDSVVSVVMAAITANDKRCTTCHPEQHSRQRWEFNPNRASMHRTSSELPGMRTSFAVNGGTYTWSLPSASTFLKTGWTTSSMMECSDCHSYSGATGPHGATMQVNIDPAYPKPFVVTTGSESYTAQLSPNSPTGMSMTNRGSAPAGIICEKCHDLYNGSSWSNVVHKEHDDRGNEGGYCNHCHTGLPHGWSRPRLIGYATDAAPYNTYRGGVQRISLKNYTPNSWQKSDCGAGCSSGRHPLSGSSWPAVDVGTTPAPTTGTVSGTVKDSATNAAISGATVTVGTKTATTSSTGAYTLLDVPAGSYAISVSATGYNAWSGSVAVTAGLTSTQNVTLIKTAALTTGTVSGTVKDSATNAAISGATVTVGTKTATTSSTGAYVITDLAAGSYAMSVTADTYDAWSGTASVTAGSTTTQNIVLTQTPVLPTDTNLARAGTATASSTDSGSYAASKAIDGSTSTYWRANGSGTEWLRVDLGSAKTVSSVVVDWYSTRYARTYRIETSVDGSNWTSRFYTTYGNGGVDTVQLSAVTARYVRVYMTRANDGDYRIREFEVWGY